MKLAPALVLSLSLVAALAPSARADEVDDVRKSYDELGQEEKAFWDFLDAVNREERDLLVLMGKAREAEELAARSPADKELRAKADALSGQMKREADARDQRIPGYNKRYATHMQKVKGIFQKVDAIFKKDPKNDKAAILRMKILADQGAVGEIREEVDRLFQAHPDDAEVRFAYGETLMVVPTRQRETGVPPHFEKAYETLAPLAKAQATNPEVQLLYGVAACAMDKNAEAKAALDSVAMVTSLRPSVRILIGNPQDPAEAFAVWRDAATGLAKNPEDAALRKKRAELLYFVGADERAIADAQLVAKAMPDDVSMKKLLVSAFTRLRRWEDAKPLYAALEAEMAKDDVLRAQHAIFLFNTSKGEEALAELSKVHDLSTFPAELSQVIRGMLGEIAQKTPEDPRVVAFRLKTFADQGAFTHIWDDIERVAKEHPEDATIRFIFAETCMCVPVPAERDPRRPPVEPRPPRFEKAYELLTPLLAAEPTNADYLLLHGVAACALGKDKEAAQELDAIAAIESCRPAVRGLLGSSRDPGQLFRRWHDIAKGLADKPGDLEWLKKRAELLVLVEDYAHAERDADVVLKAKPDDKLTGSILGRALAAQNHFERAIDAFGKDPVPEAKAEMLACLFHANRLVEFKAAWSGIKGTDERVAVARALGGAGPILMQPGAVDDLIAKWADEEKARAEDAKKDDNPRVVLDTDAGKIVLELFEDTAPNTVANFIWLVEGGFYDGIKFHRIIAGFMAQGGDPTGTGAGGPNYDIKDELKGNNRFHWRGTLSMAKTGAPDSGNSQFFMNFVPTPHLNGRHTVFGRIIEGQEVADVLKVGDAIKKATVLRKRPHEYKPEIIQVPGKTPWAPPAKK